MIFFWGILGGSLAEILSLYKLRTIAPAALPGYLCSAFYWTITVAMIIGGGVLTLAYSVSGLQLNALLAINIGASAPLIVSTLMEYKPAKID